MSSAGERRWRALAEGATEHFIVLDTDHRIVDIVRPTPAMPADAIGRSYFDFVLPEERASRRALLDEVGRTGRLATFTRQWSSPAGAVHRYEVRCVPVLDGDVVTEILLVASDVTARHSDAADRVELQEQLSQSIKMEAIGRLAGGIAHDFNNLLAVMQMDLEWIAGQLGDSPLTEDIARVREAATRGAALTHQLLAFSRKQHLQPRVIVLNDIVTEMQHMMARILGEDVKLSADLAPDLGAVEADPGQIAQVLVNLAVNARDAMPSGGQLTIETREIDLDDASATALGGLPAGRYVLLRVVDTGHGMDAATRARAFEPFFTTKGPGKGTGLGLATVFGVVRQSGGGITVESTPGVGTAFDVFLPRVEHERGAASISPPPSPPRTAAAAVLVVEDDVHVRAAVRRQLAGKGYEVLEALDGHEAIAMADDAKTRIDLLLTDVVMPGLDGPTVAARVRALRPGLRVLYMSGHTEHSAMRGTKVDRHASFLQKPFTGQTLAAAVRAALAGEPISSQPVSSPPASSH